MIPSPVAKVYAQALYDLAKDKGIVEPVRTEFSELIKLVESTPTLVSTLENYNIPLEKKTEVVSQLASKMDLSKEFSRLLEILVQKNRITFLRPIYSAYEKLVDNSNGVVRGTVTTVESLSDSERNGLSRAFGKKFGKEVLLEQRLDKALVGGLIVQVNGLTFDGSLKTTIHMLKEHLERQSI